MSGWLSFAITVILVAVAFLVLNRSIRTRTSQQSALDEIKREVGAVITELNQTTERNIELIEDRIHRLDELIRQADGRLRALKRDLPASVQDDRYSRSGRTVERAQDADGESASTAPGTRDLFSKTSQPDPGAGMTESAHTRRPGLASGSGPGSDASPVPTRERVRQLYLQGIPLERIAAITGKTIGEVELIVSLEEGST